MYLSEKNDVESAYLFYSSPYIYLTYWPPKDYKTFVYSVYD